MHTVTFTRRQVGLVLSIIMLGESLKRLAKATNTAAADLRRIAAGELAPTAGVLSYLEVRRRSGRKFIAQF
jgi:hypothetical protein